MQPSPLSVPQDQKSGRLIGLGSKHGRSFYLGTMPVASSRSGQGEYSARSCGSNISFPVLKCFSSQLASINKWRLWHSRLGHPHSAR
ncbi:hypothetical protein LINPERPRIM_LOCUS9325, partial [Linum perenne]